MNSLTAEDFPKSARLRSRRDFQRLARGAKRKTGKTLIVEYRFAPQNKRPRLGLTVIRKFGKSHDRNRFKRLVREAFRRCQGQLPTGLECIVKPRPQAREATLTGIREELVALLS